MANLETLKDFFSPETFATMESEFNAYAEQHPDEKFRFENVSTGNYVSAKKLTKATEEVERLQKEIETLQATVSSKDTDAAEQLKALQEQIDNMKAQDAIRAAEDRLNERFNSVRGTNEFINSFTENGVKTAFKAALESSENAGKSDAEIYSAVVSGLGEVYRNPQKPKDLPKMGNVDDKLDVDAFNGMTISEQMEFANTHSEQYKRMFNKE